VRALLLAITLLAALPGSAAADRPDRADLIRVAVVPGIAVNLDAARVDALSQDLADALATELDIDAVGGLEVRRRLPPDGIPPDCVATPSCVADVAKRVAANQLLFVVMVDTGTGGSIQVDTTWVDVASGRVVSRPAVDLASVSDSKSRFAAASHQLLPDAPVRPKPKTGGSLGTMTTAVPRHFTTPSKIFVGAGVVGLGVGIGFGLAARSKYDGCETAPFSCPTSERDSIRRISLVADLGFLLATGGAIAAGVIFATSGQESHLVVAPSPEGVSISAVGSF
jgi:hypothetical protein